MRVILFLFGIAMAASLAPTLSAQDAAPKAEPSTQPDTKPRIYIAAGAAWRQKDEGSSSKGEAEFRNVEIASDFDHSCGTAVIVTVDLKLADYVAEFSRHAAGVPFTAISVPRTDVSVYRVNADLVGGSTKSSLSAAVKVACQVIKKDWPEAPRDLEPKRRDRDPHPTGRTAALTQ